MALLTLDELKGHLGNTDLGDNALQLLLDSAEAAIAERWGVFTETVTEVRRAGVGPLLPLGRRALSISAVTENGVELEADDYVLRPSGIVIERLASGTNPATRWRGRVEIELEPVSEIEERCRVQLGLVKLEIAYTPGVASQSIGSWTEASSQQQGVTYAQLREEYLASLRSSSLVLR